ncbi:MAG: methyltransferase domain-containing protein [Gammaproteobacteria bacterium]|nr:methyltransferase domain-containing protein [Gammaproteobacteria bacterium]
MRDWFDTPLGRSLLEQEQRQCRALVPSGYYPSSLQVGRAAVDFLGGIESGRRFVVVDQEFIRAGGGDAGATAAGPPVHRVVAKGAALPFAEKTHNLIVLPHTLDFCEDAHAVLREVNQILVPQGCLVITGFNRLSLWGALRPVMRALARPPWTGRFRRVGRVQDWLSLLGFDLAGAAMLAYQPPLQSEKWRRKLNFIDAAGARWWPGLGAVYVIVGRKQETALTGRGAARRWRLLPGVAQPAAHRSAAALSEPGRAGRRARSFCQSPPPPRLS